MTKSRARTGAEPDSETREVEITWAVLAALFQFRIATAEQLRRLTAPDAGIEKMRGRLRRLRDEGLAEELVLPQSGRARGWYLTEQPIWRSSRSTAAPRAGPGWPPS